MSLNRGLASGQRPIAIAFGGDVAAQKLRICEFGKDDPYIWPGIAQNARTADHRAACSLALRTFGA